LTKVEKKIFHPLLGPFENAFLGRNSVNFGRKKFVDGSFQRSFYALSSCKKEIRHLLSFQNGGQKTGFRVFARNFRTGTGNFFFFTNLKRALCLKKHKPTTNARQFFFAELFKKKEMFFFIFRKKNVRWGKRKKKIPNTELRFYGLKS
jgi:hypothetical protein